MNGQEMEDHGKVSSMDIVENTAVSSFILVKMGTVVCMFWNHVQMLLDYNNFIFNDLSFLPLIL